MVIDGPSAPGPASSTSKGLSVNAGRLKPKPPSAASVHDRDVDLGVEPDRAGVVADVGVGRSVDVAVARLEGAAPGGEAEAVGAGREARGDRPRHLAGDAVV